MPRKFCVRLTDRAGNFLAESRGEFPDAEWSALQLFADEAQNLRTALLVSREPPWELELSWDAQGNLVKHNLPALVEVRELAHVLRPFILQKEPTHFYKIVNTLARRIEPAQFRALFDQWRNRFSGRDSQQALKLDIGGVVVNDEETLNTWLNAYEYHRFPAKRVIIDRLKSQAPLEMLQGVFVDLLLAQVEATLAAAGFVRYLESTSP